MWNISFIHQSEVVYKWTTHRYGEVFGHTFSYIRRPLILKYWTNEVNELHKVRHEVLHSSERELMKQII